MSRILEVVLGFGRVRECIVWFVDLGLWEFGRVVVFEEDFNVVLILRIVIDRRVIWEKLFSVREKIFCFLEVEGSGFLLFVFRISMR